MVVDRIVVRPDVAQRLAESFETALKLADGLAVAEIADGPLPTPPPQAGEGKKNVTSPLVGEVGAKRREGGKRQAPASDATPLPNPPPQGGREPAVPAARAKIHEGLDPNRLIFSSKFACPVSGFTIPEIEPRLFSFNSPHGACPACGGLGTEQKIDADLVIPDPTKSLRAGAIAPWSRSSSPYYTQTLDALAKHYKFKTDTEIGRAHV